MELTKEFLEYCKTNKNVWTIQEVIDIFGEKYPTLKMLEGFNLSLNDIKFTTAMIEDIFAWQGRRLIDVFIDLIHCRPGDLIIKAFKLELNSLNFYIIDRELKRYKYLTLPIQWQEWEDYQEENDIPEMIKKIWKLK